MRHNVKLLIDQEQGSYEKVFAWDIRADRATKERGMSGKKPPEQIRISYKFPHPYSCESDFNIFL